MTQDTNRQWATWFRQGTPPPAFGGTTRRSRGLRRGPVRTLLLVALVFIGASIAWHIVAGWMMPLLWLAAIVAVIVLAARRARRPSN